MVSSNRRVTFMQERIWYHGSTEDFGTFKQVGSGGAWGSGVYLTTSKEEALSWIGAIRREGSGKYLYTCRVHGELLSGLLGASEIERFRPYLSESLLDFYLKTVREEQGVSAALLYDRLRTNHPDEYKAILLGLGFVGLEHTTQRDQFNGVNAVVFDPSKIEIIRNESVDPNKKLSVADVLAVYSGVISAAFPNYKEIEFVCHNSNFPDSTPIVCQQQLLMDLKVLAKQTNHGIFPYVQDFSDENGKQTSLAVIILDTKNSKKLESRITELANKNNVKFDLYNYLTPSQVDSRIQEFS